MDIDIVNKKKFLCVVFPGNVVDVEVALKSLGGIKTLTETFNSSLKRPQLKFRPGDTGCVPMWGSKQQTSHLLLHVRKKRHPSTDSDEQPGGATMVTFLGIVDTVFEFSTPADFQYLPPGLRVNHSSLQPVHDLSVTEIQGVDVLDKNQLLHMPPAVFSSIDKPIAYRYMQGTQSMKVATSRKTANTSYNRIRRPSHAVLIPYTHKGVPDKPLEGGPHVPLERIEAGRKLFEERPVWSRAAFQSEVGLGQETGKNLLTQVAYYFTSGPWARLWVRLGYDPRVESRSFTYQGVDFRLRRRKLQLGEGITPSPKAMRRTVSSNLGGRRPKSIAATGVDHSNEMEPSIGASGTSREAHSCYIFRADVVPTHRQFFYQLCDIQVEEIENMVQTVKVQPECTEKDGWLPANFIEDVRKIMQTKVGEILSQQATHSVSSGHMQFDEEVSSDDDSAASTEADSYKV